MLYAVACQICASHGPLSPVLIVHNHDVRAMLANSQLFPILEACAVAVHPLMLNDGES